MILPQDIYILLKLCCLKSGWTFRLLSEQLFLSTSQIHAGLKRAELSGLFSSSRGQVNKSALEEFLVHGIKYAFPSEKGGLTIGVPTSFAAPPLNKLLVIDNAILPVWPYPEGNVSGYTIQPLYSAAPKAALLDSSFYELLSLVDAIREGRARERQLAKQEIHQILEKPRGQPPAKP